MKDILKVHATRTDSAGNGYYRASDGYYYYGNAQNGYLVETEETKRLKAQKAAWDAPHRVQVHAILLEICWLSRQEL